MKISFFPSANIEFLDAIDFYDYHSPELGLAFKKELFEALDFIQLFPNSWQKVGPHTHKCVLKKFPYVLLYIIDGEQLLISAVAHQHRHPRSYLNRK
jgi:plasmid stabilization system protein ParE